MSTRCIITLSSNSGICHVYKHEDGYLSGIQRLLAHALPFAWPLPRFEADDFAASIITADRTDPSVPPTTRGGARPIPHDWHPESIADIDYYYYLCPNPDYKHGLRAHAANSVLITAFSMEYGTPIFDADRALYTGFRRTHLLTIPLHKVLSRSSKALDKLQAGPART